MSEIKFFNIDCEKFMINVPDNHYDLAIVDPPYGIKESAHRNISRSKLAKTQMYRKEFWDYEKPQPSYFKELLRISKNQIIWGGNYFTDNLYPTRCWIVWDKVNQGSHFADCELAWTSFNTSVRMFSFMWNGMMQGSLGDGKKNNGNKKTNQKRIHPTEKPIQLYRWVLHKYAKKGFKIFDSHGGSGSHAIACDMEMCDLDICEIDEFYFTKSEKRFNEYRKQQHIKFQ